ncbi:MAG: flagellar biosynthetic protein FliP [Candidatus Schekmanbacteria bacterium RBG_13_48_7]|uniref:Flagellar biosynthetic protein FliP n=1 Tax=Candidatus Schekmanbacteria bacterium RBG_13_48_7 TaxID=1817878 RepID=A0A1F7RS74_9BACT|nr:MAG: flagellar biosynthetic protein FliP [Candidatus Schekmanbacteria bacterium RBG_13_48_7]
MNINKTLTLTIFLILFSSFALVIANSSYAQSNGPGIQFSFDQPDNPQKVSYAIQILIVLTVLTLAPAILIMITCFTRIIIVLHFIRQALGTQQMPPNQVLIGLALFLTFFIMSPVAKQVQTDALQPYLNSQISNEEAYYKAIEPFRNFMIQRTRKKDLALFITISKISRPSAINEIPTYVVIPSFIVSELKTGFQIGFLIFLPFLVIDMVVASVLLSMGMMMLPPVMISLPFKILLFVMIDGWYLIIGSLVRSFQF